MASTGTISTTLVIQFADPVSANEGFLSAEIDGRAAADGGLNVGGTSFIIGDSPVYLVYKSSNLTITKHVTTRGSYGSAGTGISVKQIETVVFANTKESNLSKVPVGAVTWTNLGGDNPSLTVVENSTKVLASTAAIAVFQAEYYANADAYRLSGVTGINGVPNMAVLILIEGAVR